MKLYLVAPVLPDNSDPTAVETRLRACITPIAALIADALAADPALFALRHRHEGSASPVPPKSHFDYAEVTRIDGADMLLSVLSACGDSSSGEWALIRSLVTCRAVYYGYDGQAFVCLTHGDPPPVSPDALVRVEECSDLLATSDYMDGLTAD